MLTLFFDLKLFDATLVRRTRTTVFELNGPVVQGARHGVTKHDALAQWSALVRTGIEYSIDLVILGAKQGDLWALRLIHATSTQSRNVLQFANAE